MNRPSNSPLLAAYFPVNDPLVPPERLKVYDDAGVDFIELGLKAKDPKLDGSRVRDAMARAPGNGHVDEAIEAAQRVRSFEHPSTGVLFCYPEDPVQEADEEWSGFDAVLCLATDPAAQSSIVQKAKAQRVRTVEFIPYDFSASDIARAKTATCYVMIQYARGKTGVRQGFDRTLETRIDRLRGEGVTCPVLSGIGISTADQAKDALAQGADGVVTGSMTIARALESADALGDYLSLMREALDHG